METTYRKRKVSSGVELGALLLEDALSFANDPAAEIIEDLTKAGIKHVSFKPGLVDGIRQVVNIAASNPHFPIILQRTGGRAGGHHSYEDVYQPILSTYPSTRQHPNIILIGGSGFCGSEDLWPYLTGD